jgi:hypothetical protein
MKKFDLVSSLIEANFNIGRAATLQQDIMLLKSQLSQETDIKKKQMIAWALKKKMSDIELLPGPNY